MGKRGPPPLPTSVKKARGTLRAGRTVATEIHPPEAVPGMPTWLDKEARAEWKRVMPQLEALRIMTDLDRAMFANYCATLSLAVRATIAYQNEGLTIEVGTGKSSQTWKHPMIAVAQEARAQAMRLGGEFGMSPASRTRVGAPPEKPRGSDKDENFLFDKPKLVVGK